MKENIYTIPVIDAFKEDTECPFCFLYNKLEKQYIEYVLGPSYMEVDVRIETNNKGFCKHHIKLLYEQKNRLGLALIMLSHMQNIQDNFDKLIEKDTKTTSINLFNKRHNDSSNTSNYINELESSCFICTKINTAMERYYDTFFYLWKKDMEFKQSFEQGKGVCLHHFEILLKNSTSKLGSKDCTDFRNNLISIYKSNINRVYEDLDWFIQKFDYRFQDEPWKNSRDALIRSILKVNGVGVE